MSLGSRHAEFAVMEEPNHAPIFVGLPEQLVRLHLQPILARLSLPAPGTKSKLTVCRDLGLSTIYPR
jgi:hypothetical protein